MGKIIVLFATLLLGACSHSAMYSITGHSQQSDLIESAFQQALEHNPDGVIAYWVDNKSGKSGSVKPLYASYDFAGPCRHFELAYFYPDNTVSYHYGQACRRNQIWRMH
jgi:surface antigen